MAWIVADLVLKYAPFLLFVPHGSGDLLEPDETLQDALMVILVLRDLDGLHDGLHKVLSIWLETNHKLANAIVIWHIYITVCTVRSAQELRDAWHTVGWYRRGLRGMTPQWQRAVLHAAVGVRHQRGGGADPAARAGVGHDGHDVPAKQEETNDPSTQTVDLDVPSG